MKNVTRILNGLQKHHKQRNVKVEILKKAFISKPIKYKQRCSLAMRINARSSIQSNKDPTIGEFI